MHTLIAGIKRRLDRLPTWVGTMGWIALAFAYFSLLGPVVDWTTEHPGYFVLMVGFGSYSIFLFGIAWDWRHGTDQLSQIGRSIRSRSVEPMGPLYGLWIILGVLLVLIVGIIVAAIVFAPPNAGSRTTLTIVLGGLCAGVSGPFFVYPTIYLLGWCKPTTTFEVTFTAQFNVPLPDALGARAQLDRMPPPRGMGRLTKRAEAAWRAYPTSLSSTLQRRSETFSVLQGPSGELQIESRTDAGDVELKRFHLDDETTICVAVTATCRSLWSRGLIVLAGQAGFNRLIATVETAILSVMLRCEVEFSDVSDPSSATGAPAPRLIK